MSLPQCPRDLHSGWQDLDYRPAVFPGKFVPPRVEQGWNSVAAETEATAHLNRSSLVNQLFAQSTPAADVLFMTNGTRPSGIAGQIQTCSSEMQRHDLSALKLPRNHSLPPCR